MSNPIQNRIGTVFIPVREIAKAREWYGKVLGISPGEILYDRLCVIPMDGSTGLVLDAEIYPENGPVGAPLFQFNAIDIDKAYAHMQQLGVELLTAVVDEDWFTFKDPDGNVLMVSRS